MSGLLLIFYVKYFLSLFEDAFTLRFGAGGKAVKVPAVMPLYPIFLCRKKKFQPNAVCLRVCSFSGDVELC